MVEILVNKIANDKQYLAWYFFQYMDIEKKSLPELFRQLNVDENRFFKLAMCKAPSAQKEDFSYRLKRIADFAEINIFPLVQIIRSVESSISFNDADAINTSLMAARQKDLNNNDDINDFIEEL